MLSSNEGLVGQSWEHIDHEHRILHRVIYLAMVVAGVGCPSASAKILFGLCYVWMKGSPTIPEWDVHTVSYAAIDPYGAPCLNF